MQGRVYPLEWWKMGSPDYSACVANCWHQCWSDLHTITCVANCWHQYWGDLRAITCVANCWHQCWGDLRTITCVANCWHQCWGDLCTITVCRNPWAGHQALLALQCAEYEWYNTKQNRYIGYFFFFTHYYLHFLFSHTIICHANRHFQMFLPRHPPPPPVRDGANSVNGTAQTDLLWLAIWKHLHSLLLFSLKVSYPGWYKHTKTNIQPPLPNPTIFLCLYVNKTNTPKWNVWPTWPATQNVLTFKHVHKSIVLDCWPCHIMHPTLHQHHTTTAPSVLATQWKCLPLTAKCNRLMFCPPKWT